MRTTAEKRETAKQGSLRGKKGKTSSCPAGKLQWIGVGKKTASSPHKGSGSGGECAVGHAPA